MELRILKNKLENLHEIKYLNSYFVTINKSKLKKCQ